MNNVKSSKNSPVPLEDFLSSLKKDWIEKVIFSNDLGTGRRDVDAVDVPPIIAPAMRGPEVYNTEMEKKSIYLNQKITTTSKYSLDGKQCYVNYNKNKALLHCATCLTILFLRHRLRDKLHSGTCVAIIKSTYQFIQVHSARSVLQ